MAQHLDLEEQEQLDQLKHFWNQWGNLISWVLIVVFGAIAAWNGWNYWQRKQAVEAAAMFDEVERAAQAGDTARVERAFGDLRDRYGRTIYAQQAGLLAGKTLAEKGNSDGAKAALGWVTEHASDAGYKAVARLRLASVLVDAKAYDAAMKQATGDFPPQFEALAADRRGDIDNLQGKRAEARAEYAKAYHGLDAQDEYRRLVEIKLASLGGDVQQQSAAPAASGAGKQ